MSLCQKGAPICSALPHVEHMFTAVLAGQYREGLNMYISLSLSVSTFLPVDVLHTSGVI